MGILCSVSLTVALLKVHPLAAHEEKVEEQHTFSAQSREYQTSLEEYNQAKEKYENAKQAYETLKESAKQAYQDYLSKKKALDDLKAEADELLPVYQKALETFDAEKESYLNRLTAYEENGMGNTQEYQELLGEYQRLETEFLDLKEQYDALQIKMGPIEKAFQTAKDAYDDIAEKKSELEQEYQTIELLYEDAFLKLEGLEKEIEVGEEAYETAKQAQEKAQTAVNQLNEELTQMNQIMSEFPNTDLFGEDYDSRLSDWQAEYEAQKTKVEVSKNAAFEAIEAYQAANDAYNASGIAPEEKLETVFGPTDFEKNYEEYLSRLEEKKANNITKIDEYIKIKTAREQLVQDWNVYIQGQQKELEIITDTNKLLGCLAPQYPKYYDPSRLGPQFDETYMEQPPTVENVSALVAAYKTLVEGLQPQIDTTVTAAIEGINQYVQQQQEFYEKIQSFNDKTGMNLEFTVRKILDALGVLEGMQTDLSNAVEFNINFYESKIDGDLGEFNSLSEYFRNNRVKLAHDLWTTVTAGNIITIPEKFELIPNDAIELELYAIQAPNIEEPTELSEKPEPPAQTSLEEPTPYTDIEPPTLDLPQPIPPKITMPMTGGVGVGGFTVTGASLIGLTHLFQERRKKMKKTKP